MEEDYCYSRTIPFKHIVEDPETYNDIIFRVNEIVKHTYQFVRMYILHCYENDKPIPTIDRSFLKTVFSLVSVRQKNSNTTVDLRNFYEKHYSPIQPEKIDGSNLKETLDHEITDMVTNVENHIKNHFYDYLLHLTSCYTETRKEARKLRNMLYYDDLSSHYSDTYPELMEYCYEIQNAKENRTDSPQALLPLLLKINELSELHGRKTMAVIPLRKSNTPKYVTFSHCVMTDTFGKELGTEKWYEICEMVAYYFTAKEDFSFSSLKTDGVGCSLLFKYKTKRKAYKFQEKYLENLQTYEELLDKKIVAIDPNKGNLMYCYDGKNVLRYTQAQRRHETKKTKYKHIRQKEEKSATAQLPSDTEVYTLKSNYQKLSQYNSKTVSVESFKDYVREKNLFSRRFSDMYRKDIFRRLNFSAKINTMKSESQFLKRFRKTYGTPDSVVVVFGDWEQKEGISYGKEPTKGKSCRALLRKAGYEVFLKDEFRTSKLCHECHAENENSFVSRKDPRPWKAGQTQKVWGLLRCKNVSCCKIHNRDLNSASNILLLSLCIIHGVEIPLRFRRSVDLTSLPTSGSESGIVSGWNLGVGRHTHTLSF